MLPKEKPNQSSTVQILQQLQENPTSEPHKPFYARSREEILNGLREMDPSAERKHIKPFYAQSREEILSNLREAEHSHKITRRHSW